MIRPSLPSRLAGSRTGSLLIWSACAFIVLGWYQGHVVWWQALVALAIAKGTLTAVGDLRRYKAWEAEWDAMGAPLGGEDAPRPKRSVKPNVTVLAWVLVLAHLLLPGSLYKPAQGVLAPAAALAFAFLLFVGCRSILRRVKRGGRMTASVTAVDENAAVAWAIDGASSSPSRIEAASNLPDYSAQLMAGRNERSLPDAHRR